MRRREFIAGLGGARGRSKPVGHGLGLTGRFPIRTLPGPRRSVEVRSVSSGTVHRLRQRRE